MNKIVFTNFVTPAQGASNLELALHRLGVYIDEERNNLSDLIDISGHEDGLDELSVLSALHLDADATPRDIERLLRKAWTSLEQIVWYVEAVPLHGDLPGQAPSEFDAFVRQSGARLQNILTSLRCTLTAGPGVRVKSRLLRKTRAI